MAAETKKGELPGWAASLLVGLGVGVVVVILGTEYRIWRHRREDRGTLPPTED